MNANMEPGTGSLERQASTTRLSIVIVTFNSRGDIVNCLESLAAGQADTSLEIVVVDNGSHDDTAAVVRRMSPGVHLIETHENLGFARANNVGIRACTGELVLLLNPDTVASPREIRRLVEALIDSPDAAVAGPRIVDADGRAELSFGPMISPLAELRQKLLVVGNDRRWPLVPRIVDRLTRTARHVDWVTGACLLIRRADLDAVGLLDERFFMYTEDADLCAAVRARGRRVLFTPVAQIVHLRGRSAASARAATRAAYRRSQIAFYEKHHPRWAPLLKLYLRLRGQLPES